MKRFTSLFLALLLGACIMPGERAFSSDTSVRSLEKSDDFRRIRARVIKEIKIPKWYHEGLFFDGKNIWVANGKKGKTWVVDLSTGLVAREIEPFGTFTEGIAETSDGSMYVTDWDENKVCRVNIVDNKMVRQSEISVAPAFPTGIAWNGKNLFVIAWTRGSFGTRFELLRMDLDGAVLDRLAINAIQEPDQMTWDGKFLWITSWFEQRVYKVDVDSWKIVGAFRSPAMKTTGVAWDGSNMWITGTYADLFKLELEEASYEGGKDMAIKVTSPAFKEGGKLPAQYTCDGSEFSVPIGWSGIPKNAISIALISDDPDAPSGDFVHWVIFNIPPAETGLAENISHDKILPNGAVQGMNDSRGVGYCSPCPPSGTHRYYFKVYALDTMLKLPPGATKRQLLDAMKGHILAEGQIIGKYERQK